MYKIKSLLLNLIFCLAGITSVAQKINNPDQYRAVQWTMQEGLNDDGLNVMLKDAKGFLWIGSLFGELSRFDGARFKRFVPDPRKPGAINAEGVTNFVEDSLHNIWIGTKSGLSRYDIQTDLFTNFLAGVDSTTGDGSMNSSGSIIPFGSTDTHIYCFESGDRIVTFDIRSLEKKTVVASSRQLDSLNFLPILLSAIFDNKSNSVWLLDPSSERGINGLVQVSLTDGKQTKYPWPVIYPDRKWKSVASLTLDHKRNSIWISTPSGLVEFSLKSKQFRFIDALNEFTKAKGYDTYGGIDIDRYGRVWFATNPHGIFIYDPETNQAHKLFSDPKLQKDVSEHNLHLYIDRDGIVWSSYYEQKGVHELIPYSPFIKMYSSVLTNNSLSHSTVTTIIPGAQGKMWIGTLDGLNIFDPVTEKFEILREKDFMGLKGKVFAPLFIDTTKQTVWLSAGTQLNYWSMKLYEVDLKIMKAFPLNFRDGSKQLDSVFYEPTFVRPFKGKYLLAEDNYGIFELKPGSREAELVIPLGAPKRSFIIGDGIIFCIVASNTPNSTFKFTGDGKWTKIPHVFDSLNWTDIRYDSIHRSYWVCLRYEISLYDEEFNKIKTFKLDEKPTGRIVATQVDASGNLWFASMLQNVGKVNPSTGSVYFLSEVDGYQKVYFDWFAPSSQDGRGNIYFGSGTNGGSISAGSLGLTKVQPGNEFSASPARVYLKTLKVNDQEYTLPISLNNLNELSMRHNENNITLEAGIIDYHSRGAGRLRFKLEGGDIQHEWLYVGPDQTIRLENLQPGSYKLLIQASTIGTEMMSPEKMLSITISKPYWQTWAFQILIVIVFITGIYSIIQYRSRSLKRQNVLLEEKITVRTNDLKHSLDELKATQVQLIQSEKMASLGQLTAGIAHEIQNPLNFVKNFSEVSQELLDEMTGEIEKGNLKEAKELSADVKENLQKVLHHGKRADGIVKGMLQHSRNSSGLKEPTAINNLADEYLRLAFHGLRAKDKTFNAAVETNFDHTVGSVNVIPQEIGRVVLNLITNAFYAVTEKKKVLGDIYEPTVTVVTKKVNARPDDPLGRDKIEISVKDNGSGIPKNIVEKVFQPFFTTKPTGEGTGLGLSLSYDIITAHRGEIKVETKEGEWTIFTIILPVV